MSPEKPLRNQDQIQFGISYISSVLKKNGHETALVVCSEISGKKNLELIERKINDHKPEILCFTAVATEYDFIARLSAYLKERHPELLRVLGGPHATLNPETVIKEGLFDAVCIGEGEYPMLELAEAVSQGKEASGIKNLWFYREGNIERNGARPFLDKLDEMPFPDRDMWQEWLDEQPGSRHAIILGRGCPFDCTYCCNHALKKVADGQYYRLRSPENIIKEIEEIKKHYPSNKEIYLEIETIGIDMKWSLELCEKLYEFNKKLQTPLSFGINLRIMPNRNLDELFLAFKKANFRFVNIGLESGSERVRKDVLRRHYSNNDVCEAVASARRCGIKVAFFNMIGLPGETYEEFKETVAMNRKCQPDWHFTSIFFPYPGTELYNTCKEQGLLKKKLDTRAERSQATLDMPSFGKKQIQKSYIWFDYHVYKGRRPIANILYGVATKKLRSKYHLKFIFNKLVNNIFFLTWIKRIVRRKLMGETYVLDDHKKAKEL